MLKDLQPGEELPRQEVHQRYGGRLQGRIGPSKSAPVVLFFTDPVRGHRHGYYDGWDEEGLFNYIGEGQSGDQRLVQGNRAIVNHLRDGRSLEGFLSRGSTVTYLGEFALVDYFFTEAPESGDPDVIRQVIVFRLRPVGQLAPVQLPTVPVTRARAARIDAVAVESRHTERAFLRPEHRPNEAERHEADLLHRFQDHLLRQGHEVSRLRMVPTGDAAPLYCDLWDATTREIIEVKSRISRDHLRNAVGELLDYKRFTDAATCTVLVPSRPRDDLCAYLGSVGIHLVYPESDDTWHRITPETHAHDAGSTTTDGSEEKR